MTIAFSRSFGATVRARYSISSCCSRSAVVLIRTAWVSDDAYITFRTIDNFIDGYGLRWNIAERVQSYTHPLWMFVVAFFYLLTGEFFFTSMFLSITISVATMLVVVKGIARTGVSAVSCSRGIKPIAMRHAAGTSAEGVSPSSMVFAMSIPAISTTSRPAALIAILAVNV